MILKPTDDNIGLAARTIRAGGLAAFPTETVYGLGADAFNEEALALVFEVKRRPRFDPLIIHIARTGTLSNLVDFSFIDALTRKKLDTVIEAFWPGPLTLVLPKLPRVPDIATAGLPTLAVRFPANKIAQKLISLSGGAVAAPSANPFGCLSPTSAAHVENHLGGAVPIIIDGGDCEIGVESTVLRISGTQNEPPVVLRHGGVTLEELQKLLPDARSNDGAPKSLNGGISSPGQLTRHYSPKTPLFLHAHGEMAALAKEPDAGYLYIEESLLKTAASLFRKLQEMDAARYKAIHAELAPEEGLGRAINDRLRRGAAGC